MNYMSNTGEFIDTIDSDDNLNIDKEIEKINDATKNDLAVDESNKIIDELKKTVVNNEIMIAELTNKIDVLTNKISNLNNTKKVLDDLYVQLTKDIASKNNEINEIKEKNNGTEICNQCDDVIQSPLMKQLCINNKDREQIREQEQIHKQEQIRKQEQVNKQIPTNQNITKSTGKITPSGLMMLARRIR